MAWRVTGVLLTLLVVLAHLDTLSGEFVLDDRPFLVDNPRLERSARPADFFTHGVWWFSNLPDAGEEANYRPLVTVALWAKNQLWHGDPAGFHAASILMHLAATLLLLLWLRRLSPTMDARAAGLAVALFAVHPVHVEAIAWISGSLHLQATLLLLITCLLYDRFVRLGGWRWLVLANLFYLGALLTVEVVAAFPVFLLVYEYVRRGRVVFWNALPCFLLLAGYLVARKMVLGTPLPLTWDSLAAWMRLFSFAVESLRHLLWPWPQPLYLATPADGVTRPESGWLALVMLTVMIWPVVRTRTLPGLPLLALAWLGSSLAPPLLAALNPTPLLALRTLYLPSVGVVLLLAWGLDRLRGKWWIGQLLLVLLALGGTLAANRAWRNDGVVYARIVGWHPEHAAGHAGLAQYAARTGQLQEAMAHYRTAMEKARGKARLDLMEPLALLLGRSGHHGESLALFRQVTVLAPQRASAWVGVGNNLWFMRRPQEAVAAYRNAVRADPRNQEACHNLNMALGRPSVPCN
ncbi:MAG: tetratricopeptide repeat protein [Magnetococcales bacterium]|nr:tetratricopeptide repeat protein [Magnetococcales bacterium]